VIVRVFIICRWSMKPRRAFVRALLATPERRDREERKHAEQEQTYHERHEQAQDEEVHLILLPRSSSATPDGASSVPSLIHRQRIPRPARAVDVSAAARAAGAPASLGYQPAGGAM